MGYKGCSNCAKTMRDDGSSCPHCGLTETQAAGQGPRYLCTTCGARTNPVSLSTFSGIIFLGLLLVMVLPGLIYLVLHLAGGRATGCPVCRKPTLIPIDSPVAKAALATHA